MKRSAEMLMVFIELAKIIPAKGMMVVGLYQGSTFKTKKTTKNKVNPPPRAIEKSARQ
jgi:hypothetical protein